MYFIYILLHRRADATADVASAGPARARGQPTRDGAEMREIAALFEPELDAWRGRAPLWRVFWLHGAGVSVCLLAWLLPGLEHRHVLPLQAGLAAYMGYTAWVLVAVWRCTANAAPFWGDLARIVTVAWAANTLMLGVFLEIELLGRLL